jgi:hypothetical protein
MASPATATGAFLPCTCATFYPPDLRLTSLYRASNSAAREDVFEASAPLLFKRRRARVQKKLTPRHFRLIGTRKNIIFPSLETLESGVPPRTSNSAAREDVFEASAPLLCKRRRARVQKKLTPRHFRLIGTRKNIIFPSLETLESGVPPRTSNSAGREDIFEAPAALQCK